MNAMDISICLPYKYTGKELDRMHGLDLHDHGARWSDTNIGRWHKVDRYAEKYYPISPYSMCGNNPTRFLDLSGDTLQLKGSEADVTTMITTINTGLGGYYTTSIDKNGIVSITPVEGHNNSKMSNAERVFFSIVNSPITGNSLTSINVVNNDSQVMIGEIKSFKVDIGDIKSCGKGEYFNSLSTLAHELHEEYLVQGKGVSIEKAHLNACLKEAQLTGGFISPSSRIIEGNIIENKGNSSTD